MQNTYKLPVSYYSSLLETELVDEILSSFEEHEREDAIAHLIESLDHAILEAILHFLEDEVHDEFLDMLENKYHDPEIIDWLEERKEGMIPHIQEVARKTKITIIEITR
ncbi:MAG: hypothetical protein ABFQ62_04720 [Patescibacteria group bacterium]